MTNSITTEVKTSEFDRTAGLYVHVPFCRSKCSYCGFYSITDFDRVNNWKDAILQEAATFRCRFEFIDTVYFGGGTPSSLPKGIINEIYSGLKSIFRITPDAEITVEMNPDDVRKDLLRELRKGGVNRLSIGIQSLDDEILTFLGRRHTSIDAKRAVELSREEGYSNIGIDLMYNIPGQTVSRWIDVLEAALAMEPEHISCYELSLENGTPLKEHRGKLDCSRGFSEHDRQFYLETSRIITAREYLHYEVSNYARDFTFRSRHNRKYWIRDPYLGLGPSAHSMRGTRRWWNARTIVKYLDSVRFTGNGIEASEILTDEQIALESLFLGFRNTHGIPRSLIMSDQHNATITQSLVERNLLRDEGNYFVPTVEGYLLADRLPLDYRL